MEILIISTLCSYSQNHFYWWVMTVMSLVGCAGGLHIPQRADENAGRRFWSCLPSQFQDEEDQFQDEEDKLKG